MSCKYILLVIPVFFWHDFSTSSLQNTESMDVQIFVISGVSLLHTKCLLFTENPILCACVPEALSFHIAVVKVAYWTTVGSPSSCNVITQCLLVPLFKSDLSWAQRNFPPLANTCKKLSIVKLLKVKHKCEVTIIKKPFWLDEDNLNGIRANHTMQLGWSRSSLDKADLKTKTKCFHYVKIITEPTELRLWPHTFVSSCLKTSSASLPQGTWHAIIETDLCSSANSPAFCPTG